MTFSHAFLFTTKLIRISTLQAKNKLDGNFIEGDLQPLHNNVFIKLKAVATATTGGLFIPENAKERPTEGNWTRIYHHH